MGTPEREKLSGQDELHLLRYSVCVIVAVIALSYSSYLVFAPPVISALGKEDGFFEDMTALFFLAASFAFLACFIRYRGWFFLLLSLVFFFGCGEEISWGQRIIGFETPDIIEEINVQEEFTLHNIEIFNAEDSLERRKGGLSKLLTINFQYKLFWLAYGVLLPIAVRKIPPAASFFRKSRLPVPPLAIGIFFLVNWLIYRILLSFILPPGEGKQFYDTSGEIMECMSAFLFMVLGIYFYKAYKERNGRREAGERTA